VFDSLQGQGIVLYSTASRLALGPTQPHSQLVPGACSQGVKQLGHEADHSPPSSTEVKNSGAIAYLHSPIYFRGVVFNELLKHRDNFTFFLHL
jgi:hypothetical protein